MNTIEVFAFKDFLDFLTGRVLHILLKDDQIFTRLSIEHKELRSVKIFWLSFVVQEL